MHWKTAVRVTIGPAGRPIARRPQHRSDRLWKGCCDAVRLALAAAVVGSGMPHVRAATLLTWDITGSTGGTSGSVAAALVSGISGSTLNGTGSGSTLANGNSTSPANTWNRTYQATTYTTGSEAMANGQFLWWTTTVDAGYTASFSGITGMSLARTSNGAQWSELWYSLDGLTFAQTGSASAVTTTPTSAATAFSSAMATSPVVLAGGETGSTITWRMVSYSGTGGRLGILKTSTDDFSMLGTVTGGFAKDLTWVGATGTGTWNTDSANLAWTSNGSPAAFAASDNVTFGTAGEVTVAGGVSAGAIAVSHTAGLLTIGGEGFAGTTLAKSGAGTLLLTASNALSGGVSATDGTIRVGAAGAVGSKAVTLSGGTLGFSEPAVASLANPIVVGAAGAAIANASDLTMSGAITAGSGAAGSTFVKSGTGSLSLTGAFGVQTTAPVELNLLEGSLTLAGTQKNIGGGNDWNGPVALSGAVVMIHSGTVRGSGTVTNTAASSVIASRLNAGAVSFECPLVLDQLLTGSSPNGNNTLRFYGPISGSGGLTAAGNGTKQLWGTNTYAGPTTVTAGTLVFGTKASLYNATPANWTSANLIVQSGATASFRVGGVGQFEAADLDVLLGLGTASDGFLSGARAGIDTTDGDFTYASGIANPNSGANVLGLTKSGSNMLTLSGSNTYSGVTSVTAGTLTFATTATLYGGDTANWTAANLVVAGGATAAFRVGGAGQFTAADIDQLAVLGSGSNGFGNGAAIGFDTPDAGGTFTYSGVLANTNSGSNSLGVTKLGSGTLALAGANTYSGPTTVQAGTLRLEAVGALGSGALAVNGGSLDLGGYSLTVSTLSGSAGGAITNSVVASPATLTINVASGTTAYGGVIDDAAGVVALVKTGAGDLLLSGSSTFSGGTRLDGDILIEQPASLGRGPITSTGPAARIYWSGTDAAVTILSQLVTGDDIGDALAFAPGSDRSVVLAGTISGSGQIKVSANATATLDLTQQTSLTNTNTGGVEIGTGRVLIASGANLGGGTVNFGTGSNSTLVVSGSGTTVVNPLTIGTTGSTGAGTAKFDTNGGFLVIEGAIADRPGNLPGSLAKLGSGTLTLRAANTYTGTTTVQQGTLAVANAEALATTSVTVSSGAKLAVAPDLRTTVKGLSLASGGLVDVTAGGMTVTSGLSATELVAQILAGRGDGSWTGTSGITSSTAAADVALGTPRAVGWLDGGGGALAFAFAAPGDTNLDWQVDVLDAANMLAAGNYNANAAGTWSQGDFNYDGLVNVLDAAAFVTTGLYNQGFYNPPPSAVGTVAAVPEPSGLWVIGIGAALTMFRSRRRHSAATGA